MANLKAMTAAVVGIAAGAATASFVGQLARTPANATPVAEARSEPAVPTAHTPDTIFSRCSPSVVQLRCDGRNADATVLGSGFVVRADGLIATNYHVVEGAVRVEATFADGVTRTATGAVALDRDGDLAVLKLNDRTGLNPLPLADDALPPVGGKVFAIGSPLGFSHTLSDGLVSGHRPAGAMADFPEMPALIQTSAPISKGSSGGPLLSPSGSVVGVTTLGYGLLGGENLNFAVPISRLSALLKRCPSDSTTVPFPAARVAVAPPAVGGWTKDDTGNAAHFVRAMRANSAAWAVCREADRRPWRPGDPPEITNGARGRESKVGRPWLMNGTDQWQFRLHMRNANQEGMLVRRDVLRRIHPELPDAFGDFLLVTSAFASNAAAPFQNLRVRDWDERWGRWMMSNRANLDVPSDAKK